MSDTSGKSDTAAAPSVSARLKSVSQPTVRRQPPSAAARFRPIIPHPTMATRIPMDSAGYHAQLC